MVNTEHVIGDGVGADSPKRKRQKSNKHSQFAEDQSEGFNWLSLIIIIISFMHLLSHICYGVRSSDSIVSTVYSINIPSAHTIGELNCKKNNRIIENAALTSVLRALPRDAKQRK